MQYFFKWYNKIRDSVYGTSLLTLFNLLENFYNCASINSLIATKSDKGVAITDFQISVILNYIIYKVKYTCEWITTFLDFFRYIRPAVLVSLPILPPTMVSLRRRMFMPHCLGFNRPVHAVYVCCGLCVGLL